MTWPPDYHDAQLRGRLEVGPGEAVELGGMLSSDVQQRTSPRADPTARQQASRKLEWNRADLRYTKAPSGGAEVVVQPWLGTDSQRVLNRFGTTATELQVDSTLYGLRSFYHGLAAKDLTATVGFDFELTDSRSRRSGSITSPAREGDPFVFGRPPADQLAFDEWHAVVGSAAAYAEIDSALWSDRIHVVPGARLEPFFTSIDRRIPTEGDSPAVGAYSGLVSFQPRLALSYSPVPAVTFKAACGVYRQPPLADDLSAVFGNPLLGTAQGTHWLGGVSVTPTRALSLETTVFYTRSRDLPVRNTLASPLVAESLVGDGRGRSYGSQILLRRNKQGRSFGWIAYTLLRSERLDAPGGEWRLFDFDQTHVLTALGAYDLGAGFEVGGRVRSATGYPRTPVRRAFYDARRDRYEPELGARNSERIAAFFQVDARVSKTFHLARGELEAYLDIQNVLSRENPEEIAYSADYRQKRLITGLPILPVVGARWSF